MTAAAPHRLPEPDPSAVQIAIAGLEALGVHLSREQRHTLAAIHEYGWLSGPAGVARMLLDASAPARAAQERRVVRDRREASAEAKFHASQPHPRQTRVWSFVDGGFRCHLCGIDFLRYVDPAGAASAAQDHTQQCDGGGTDV